MCCFRVLFKYTTLATLENVFWQFQVIGELLNTILENSVCIKVLQNKKHSWYVAYMHG